MPLSGPQQRCGAVLWPATHREVLACMLLFGSVRMNTAYLYRPWARVKTTCYYASVILRHFTRTVQINILQMLSWRISELICVFIEAKVKRSGRKIPKIIGHMQQVELPTEAEFLDEIQTIVLRVFLLVIHSHYTALPWGFCFFKLTQPLTVSTVQLLYTVK